MKRNLLYSLLCAGAILFTVCEPTYRGDDLITQEESDIPTTAHQITVSSALRLILSDEVAVGEIKIVANKNIQLCIEVSKADDAIAVSLDPNKNYKDIEVEITVSAQQFNTLKATGASRILLEDAPADFDRYDITLSGASRFEGELPTLAQLNLTLSGASRAEIEGRTAHCKVVASSASRVAAEEFVCSELEVELTGASRAEMAVTQQIAGSLSGASKLTNCGEPLPWSSIDVTLTGDSKLEQEPQ